VTKQDWREHVWKRLEEAGAALFPGPQGRVPGFKDALRAADRLAETDAWRAAFVVMINPDAAQRSLRARALYDGKIVFVPVPRLANRRCFLKLDPAKLDSERLDDAASLRGACRHGLPVAPKDIPLLDLVVCGSVAVNAMGQRIGKGGGCTDLAYALGREHGFLMEETVIATMVHPLQVVDDPLPVVEHDVDLDIIATPHEVIRSIRSRLRPRGILWQHLTPQKLSEIPVLGRMRRGRGALRER
jgi:5-formyltetrahydrofolate cyclo-ligase